jgi:hypothetical protein
VRIGLFGGKRKKEILFDVAIIWGPIESCLAQSRGLRGFFRFRRCLISVTKSLSDISVPESERLSPFSSIFWIMNLCFREM